MRGRIGFALALSSVVCLVACANHAAESDRLWKLSTTGLNEGNFQGGIQAARDLRSYDRNKSAYLVGQLMVYDAASHGANFTLVPKNSYQDLLSIDVDASDPYLKEILVAKMFALRFTEGPSKASLDSKAICAVVHQQDVGSCVAGITMDAEKKYLNDPSRFNAVYLFQAATLGDDFGAVEADETIFLRGLATFKMDERRALFLMDLLNRRKAITRKMWDRYCPLAQRIELDIREEVCAAAKYANTPPFFSN